MIKTIYKLSAFLLFVLVLATGCATTRARKPEATPEQNTQASQLQQQLQAKDQQIHDLQYQLSKTQSATNANDVSTGLKDEKSSIIRVPGVSVIDVQKVLIRAGYDPGPADGRAGKKTKSAIKKFQRKHNLAADGVVGEKTWNRLK